MPLSIPPKNKAEIELALTGKRKLYLLVNDPSTRAPGYEMPVIGHERVTVKSKIDPIEPFEQDILKGLVVNVFVEHGFHPVIHAREAAAWSWACRILGRLRRGRSRIARCRPPAG